jgi:hypothetical protein
MAEEFAHYTTDEPVKQIARKTAPHFSITKVNAGETWEIPADTQLLIFGPTFTNLGTLIINGTKIHI